jgi:hypothetical protein
MIFKQAAFFLFLTLFATKAHSIQNGSEDYQKRFENVVKLSVLVNHQEWSICTATILSDHIVLTAGHCINYYLDLDSIPKIKINDKNYKIKNTIPNPEFSAAFSEEMKLIERIKSIQIRDANSPELEQLWTEYGNLAQNTALVDVALLVTEKTISKSIPRNRISFSKALAGESVIFVGFGFNKYDTESHKYVYENGARRFYGQANVSFESEMYATYDESGTGPVTAPGDSGGPLLNSNGDQIAVISHGSSLRRGTIYTPLLPLQSFLKMNLNL